MAKINVDKLYFVPSSKWCMVRLGHHGPPAVKRVALAISIAGATVQTPHLRTMVNLAAEQIKSRGSVKSNRVQVMK